MWCGTKNISDEMKLASSPLNHVKQKYKFLGIDGDHHKQKCHQPSKRRFYPSTTRKTNEIKKQLTCNICNTQQQRNFYRQVSSLRIQQRSKYIHTHEQAKKIYVYWPCKTKNYRQWRSLCQPLRKKQPMHNKGFLFRVYL